MLCGTVYTYSKGTIAVSKSLGTLLLVFRKYTAFRTREFVSPHLLPCIFYQNIFYEICKDHNPPSAELGSEHTENTTAYKCA